MLNQSKGPAVHSLRAQADKQAYSTEMRKTLENTENLTIRQGEVTELLVEDGHITGVKTFSGATYHAKAVVSVQEPTSRHAAFTATSATIQDRTAFRQPITLRIP